MTENTQRVDMSQGFTLTRELNAPREVVWTAWTDPEHLTHWFHPNGMTSPREEIHVDLRVGGHYRYVMVADDTGERVPTGGTYLELDPPERLVFTWGSPDDAVEDSPVITVTLADRGDRTEMTFQLQGVPGYVGDEFVHDGWNEALDFLTKHLHAHSV